MSRNIHQSFRGPVRPLPRFSNARVIIALPLILAALLLYFATACIMLVVDAITGRPLSQDLL